MINASYLDAESMAKCLFVDLARLNVGIIEEPNDNDYGSAVLRYQRSVNGQHYKGKQPWCMDFVYWCAWAVHIQLMPCNLIVEGYHRQFRLQRTSSCVDQYRSFNRQLYPVKQEPQVGDVVLWERADLVHGHTGIVTSVDDDQDTFITVEGNTSDPMHRFRQTGVFFKKRSVKHPPAHDWKLLGFIEPFYYSND